MDKPTCLLNYKLVIFDFDGTLADSFPYFLRTVNALAVTYDLPIIQDQEVEQLRGLDARQLIKRVNLPIWKLLAMARSFRQLMARDIDQIALFTGVPALLKTLAGRGVTLAIVSSNSERNIRRVLGPENASLISYYGCGSSLFTKHRKIKRAMKKLRIKAWETLCVGDEIRDIEAAHRVETAFGGVAWGYTRPDAIEAYPNVLMFYTPTDIVEAVVAP